MTEEDNLLNKFKQTRRIKKTGLGLLIKSMAQKLENQSGEIEFDCQCFIGIGHTLELLTCEICAIDNIIYELKLAERKVEHAIDIANIGGV